MLEVFCLIFGIRSRTLQYVASYYASNIYSARFPHSQHLSLGLSTIQLFLKCENKRNLERGVFTPETKELQVRESCQLGGDRERARERAGKKHFFAPLAEFSACRGPCASPVFCCCDNQAKRGERERNGETDRARGGKKKSADQLAWQQQRCNPTRHTLINAPSADGLLRINKKEASGHTAPPPLHYHHHNLPFQFPPTHPPLLVTCQHTQLKKNKQKLNCTKNNKKTP